MHLTMAALLEFHKKMGQTIGDPRKPNVQQEQEFRLRLIHEELKELEEALEADDIVKAADGLADLVYVLAGSAVTWGIDLASVFDEVHRSNMTKKRENKREDGKVLKDEDFSPAQVKEVLKEAADNFNDTGIGEDGWWEDPSPQVTEKVMMAAKDQARAMAEKAMRDIKADFSPGVKSNGLTVDGKPYTVDENYPLQEPESRSDGVPKAIKGEMTAYGAFVFDCVCDRRHAVQAKLGTRGGMAPKGTCECICGKAYSVDFSGKEPKITYTTIEALRKIQNG